MAITKGWLAGKRAGSRKEKRKNTKIILIKAANYNNS